MIGDGPASQPLVDGVGRPHPALGTVPAALDGVALVQGPEHLPQRAPTFFPKEWVWTNYDTVFSDSLFTSPCATRSASR